MTSGKAKWFIRWLLISVLASLFYSCTLRGVMLDEMVGVIETGIPAFEEENDLDLLEKAIPANIKLLETLRVSRPSNSRLLTLLSRMYAGYSFSFMEDRLDALILSERDSAEEERSTASLKTALSRYYVKGANYALDALETEHPNIREKLATVSEALPFLKTLSVTDVPALFWYGFNLAAYVNRNLDSIQAISKAHLAEKAMLRVIELDETYYHGSAHLLLMIYYASLPPMMGGKPEKALHHYRQLKRLAGENFLIADVYYARHYLYRTQERQAYEEVLASVLAHSGNHPTAGLLNAVALQRAEIYLKAADHFFDPD